MQLYIIRVGLYYAFCYVEDYNKMQNDPALSAHHFAHVDFINKQDISDVISTELFPMPDNLDYQDDIELAQFFENHIRTRYEDHKAPFDVWRGTYGLPQFLLRKDNVESQLTSDEVQATIDSL